MCVVYSNCMEIKSFNDLIVWQKSMEFVENVYSVTKLLPAKEKFGLISQLQRSSVSIPSNIAEGSKRSSRADFRQFCTMALASAAEAETQLLLIQRLYPTVLVEKNLNQAIEIQKMLSVLVRQLKPTPKT